jgi:hypothetical protein
LCEYRAVDHKIKITLEAARARVDGAVRALRRLAKRSRTLRRIKGLLKGRRQQAHLELAGLRARLAGEGGPRTTINPERMVWIFGSGRSGSTWLRSMMGEMGGHHVWEEPMVGRLFGEFYARSPQENRRSADFIMGEPIRKGWTRSVRDFVLDGAAYSNPQTRADDYLIIKEPNGSIGAPLMMEAFPESRMILLVRDPRDVVASSLDARSEGGWNFERNKDRRQRDGKQPPKKGSVSFAEGRARRYLRGMGNAKMAYDAHDGPKALVRYEELRADTLGTTRRIYSTLGVTVNEEELARVVEEHSWENIPEEEKGEGKFYRKASPGSWREDLTPEQADMVEKVTAPLLKELYPENT